MALDLDFYREKLAVQRDQSLAQDLLSESDRAPVIVDQDSVGRLSRIDAMQVQSMAIAQQRRRQVERAAIDAALKRIDGGEFGYCTKCGDEIAEPRLRHNPAAASCIQCAREG